MGTTFFVLMVIVTISSVLAMLHFLYLVSRAPATLIRLAPSGEWGEWTMYERIYVGLAVLAFGIAGFGATKSLLFWLPGSIGHNEDGEWVSLKSSIACIGSWAAIWVGHMLYELGDIKVKLAYREKMAVELESMLSYTLQNFRYAADKYAENAQDRTIDAGCREAYEHLAHIAHGRVQSLEKIETME